MTPVPESTVPCAAHRARPVRRRVRRTPGAVTTPPGRPPATSPPVTSSPVRSSPVRRGKRLAEPTADVVGGTGSSGSENTRCVGPYSTRRPGFSSPSTRKNAVLSETRSACCMLCVTITTVTVWHELPNRLFDDAASSRVERRARLVHEQNFGAHRERTRDAETLLLTARQPGTGLVETVARLLPQTGTREALLDELVLVADLQARRAADRSGRSGRSSSTGTGWASGTPCRRGRVSVTRSDGP